MMISTRRGVACLAVLVLWLPGCSRNEFHPPPPAPVTVAKPFVDPETTYYLELPADLAAHKTVELRAQVTGYLQEVLFEEGSQVKEGQALYQINPDRYQAAVDRAEAELQVAIAEEELAEVTLKRVTAAMKEDAATEIERLEAVAKRDRAAEAVVAARATKRSAEIDLGYTKVVAPCDGVIAKTLIDPGNLVQRDQTLLTTIVQSDPIRVEFYVSEQDRRRLREARRAGNLGDSDSDGIELRFRFSEAAREYDRTGRASYISPTIDPRTGTFLVRADFPNEQGILVPGERGRVRIPFPLGEQILVAEFSLQRDLAGYYVYVVNENDVVERRDITVGPRIGQFRLVVEKEGSLTRNDRVVIRGLQRARVGAKVAVEEETLERPVDTYQDQSPTDDDGGEAPEPDDADGQS